ncbi:MAG: BCD family MFS transporter [Myxococcota bacterium]
MKYLSWVGIVRLGLVQTALGGIVVLCLSVLNRVMTVELALAASIPGFLVTIHHAVQMSRPRWGFSSDMGGRRSPWIVLGMAILAIGAVTAALATALSATHFAAGFALGIVAYLLIGAGVGAAGTTLLAMLAARVVKERRAAAASIVWLMMIAGFIITTGVTQAYLDPFTLTRLVVVTAVTSVICFVVACLAIIGLERGLEAEVPEEETTARFRDVFAGIWADPRARAFTIFVFVSMLAYGMQDLILEPFAGKAFNFTPGESTKLSSQQYQGAFVGMILAGALAGRFGSIRLWTVSGCIASGIALLGLTVSGWYADWPLTLNVAGLGFATGVFAIAAISWMMTLAGDGIENREGSKMGLWGAAQAIGTALGAFAGATSVDLVSLAAPDGPVALPFATVFALEGAVFIVAGFYALTMERAPVLQRPARTASLATAGGIER